MLNYTDTLNYMFANAPTEVQDEEIYYNFLYTYCKEDMKLMDLAMLKRCLRIVNAKPLIYTLAILDDLVAFIGSIRIEGILQIYNHLRKHNIIINEDIVNNMRNQLKQNYNINIKDSDAITKQFRSKNTPKQVTLHDFYNIDIGYARNNNNTKIMQIASFSYNSKQIIIIRKRQTNLWQLHELSEKSIISARYNKNAAGITVKTTPTERIAVAPKEIIEISTKQSKSSAKQSKSSAKQSKSSAKQMVVSGKQSKSSAKQMVVSGKQCLQADQVRSTGKQCLQADQVRSTGKQGLQAFIDFNDEDLTEETAFMPNETTAATATSETSETSETSGDLLDDTTWLPSVMQATTKIAGKPRKSSITANITKTITIKRSKRSKSKTSVNTTQSSLNEIIAKESSKNDEEETTVSSKNEIIAKTKLALARRSSEIYKASIYKYLFGSAYNNPVLNADFSSASNESNESNESNGSNCGELLAAIYNDDFDAVRNIIAIETSEIENKRSYDPLTVTPYVYLRDVTDGHLPYSIYGNTYLNRADLCKVNSPLAIAALFGAVKCFKLFYMNSACCPLREDEDLQKFTVINCCFNGRNHEIFHIIEQCAPQAFKDNYDEIINVLQLTRNYALFEYVKIHFSKTQYSNEYKDYCCKQIYSKGGMHTLNYYYKPILIDFHYKPNDLFEYCDGDLKRYLINNMGDVVYSKYVALQTTETTATSIYANSAATTETSIYANSANDANDKTIFVIDQSATMFYNNCLSDGTTWKSNSNIASITTVNGNTITTTSLPVINDSSNGVVTARNSSNDVVTVASNSSKTTYKYVITIGCNDVSKAISIYDMQLELFLIKYVMSKVEKLENVYYHAANLINAKENIIKPLFDENCYTAALLLCIDNGYIDKYNRQRLYNCYIKCSINNSKEDLLKIFTHVQQTIIVSRYTLTA